MKSKFSLFVTIALIVSFLSSCTAAVSTEAANSIGGVLAVCFEGIYAIITIIVVLFLGLLRALGFSFIGLSVLSICHFTSTPLDNRLVLLIGLLCVLVSLCPVKPYAPKVIITKNPKLPKDETSSNSFSLLREVLIPLMIGVVLLCVEYAYFQI